MALLTSISTEDKRRDDVVYWEVEHQYHYCREVKTILDGTVMTIGKGAKLNAAGKVVALAAADVDDVQTLTLAAGTDGGTFVVEYKGFHTAANAWNITAANLQVALRALHADLAACTVGLVGEIYTVTNVGGIQTDLYEIENDSTNDGGVAEGGVVVARSAVGVNVGQDIEMISLTDQSPSGADGEGVFIVRGPCIVNGDQLVLPTSGLTGAILALEAKGIVVRREPTKQSTPDS